MTSTVLFKLERKWNRCSRQASGRSCFSAVQCVVPGTSLVAQWLALHALTAAGVGSTPGWKTTISCASQKVKGSVCWPRFSGGVVPAGRYSDDDGQSGGLLSVLPPESLCPILLFQGPPYTAVCWKCVQIDDPLLLIPASVLLPSALSSLVNTSLFSLSVSLLLFVFIQFI